MWTSKITKEDLTNDVIDRLLFEGLHDNEISYVHFWNYNVQCGLIK